MNGRARSLLLLVFIAQATAQLVTRGRDIVEATRALLLNVPTDAVAAGLVLCQILIALWAIYDGWRHDREARSRLSRDSFLTDRR